MEIAVIPFGVELCMNRGPLIVRSSRELPVHEDKIVRLGRELNGAEEVVERYEPI